MWLNPGHGGLEVKDFLRSFGCRNLDLGANCQFLFCSSLVLVVELAVKRQTLKIWSFC